MLDGWMQSIMALCVAHVWQLDVLMLSPIKSQKSIWRPRSPKTASESAPGVSFLFGNCGPSLFGYGVMASNPPTNR